ncbi:CPBP family intramembrane glutamic endopeptidase, partial [Gorillibacterium massiliense]|uniref:CPBP family intramembrane glutamic endopeptidase n=1 Tax=Gorillibacterium massiliense TaxID=1280390 RepID=UPI00059322BD
LLAIALYFHAVSGDQIWREKGWYSWMRWRDEGFGRHIYNSMGRGYLLCLFILGVQQVLFLFADGMFHSFAVNDPSQALENMRWPMLLPLMAWMAGISEELTYRLFGIALFKKMFKLRFLAILLPSLIWAMGHTGYAIYPSYTRLLEVAVLGIIFGYAFLKYGLYTAIFTHITMDSILMGLSLAIQGRTDYTLTGLLYMALPFLFAAATLYLHATLRKPRPAAQV